MKFQHCHSALATLSASQACTGGQDGWTEALRERTQGARQDRGGRPRKVDIVRHPKRARTQRPHPGTPRGHPPPRARCKVIVNPRYRSTGYLNGTVHRQASSDNYGMGTPLWSTSGPTPSNMILGVNSFSMPKQPQHVQTLVFILLLQVGALLTLKPAQNWTKPNVARRLKRLEVPPRREWVGDKSGSPTGFLLSLCIA